MWLWIAYCEGCVRTQRSCLNEFSALEHYFNRLRLFKISRKILLLRFCWPKPYPEILRASDGAVIPILAHFPMCLCPHVTRMTARFESVAILQLFGASTLHVDFALPSSSHDCVYQSFLLVDLESDEASCPPSQSPLCTVDSASISDLNLESRVFRWACPTTWVVSYAQIDFWSWPMSYVPLSGIRWCISFARPNFS